MSQPVMSTARQKEKDTPARASADETQPIEPTAKTEPPLAWQQASQHAIHHPKLTCSVSFYPNQVVFWQDGQSYSVDIAGPAMGLLPQLLACMDGRFSTTQLEQMFGLGNVLETLLCDLERQGLIKECRPLGQPRYLPATVAKAVEETLNNPALGSEFWHKVNTQGADATGTLRYGLAIELYGLWGDQNRWENGFPWKDGFCAQAVGLGAALASIGIEPAALQDLLPRPSTMALAQSLSYWKHFDTPFYQAIARPLVEGLKRDFNRYVLACEGEGCARKFLEALQSVSFSGVPLAKSSASKNCSAALSQSNAQPHRQGLAPLGEVTYHRYLGQAHLLGELVDGFYQGIARHYPAAPYLLRQVSDI